MKNNKIIVRVIVAVLMFFIIFCLKGERIYAGEEVYFDDEGNLIYITYDKKASGSISYKAIGWIIKRYDAPMDAPGQQYVIVRKIEYAVDDVNNPGYLYCYFWSDKDEILGAVEKVSKEWRTQLEKYGDMVYIDNVMTVCNNRVPLGNVDKNGVCTGEVYYTFEGISTARGWAQPQYLKSYFDIKLRFPILYKQPEKSFSTVFKTTDVVNSNVLNSVKIDSHSLGEEEYDITLGMPAGEDVYFNGICDRFYCNVKYSRYQVVAYVPVKVNTTYTIKWKNINGEAMSEVRTISRWYLVGKNVSYTTIDTADIYSLYELQGTSSLFNQSESIYCNNGYNNISVIKNNYGISANHILVPSVTCTSPSVVLSSNNYIKPSIPEVSYQSVANKSVGNLKVRSDGLVVDGKVILSNEYYDNNAAEIKKNITPTKQSIYREGVLTNENALNGLAEDIVVKCIYRNINTGSDWYNNININAVNIHTPVVCKGSISSEKSINQSVNPTSYDIVLDGDFYVKTSNYGNHRSIKGYGVRDYVCYVDREYVKFPFDVYYDGERVEKNTWILLKCGISKFNMPSDVELGRYTVCIKSLAKNAGEDTDCLGNYFNEKQEDYGAYDEFYINVIGRLYDLWVSTDDMRYVAGKFDKNGREKKTSEEKYFPVTEVISGKKYDITIKSAGNINESTRVKGLMEFFFINNTGEVREAEVYVLSNSPGVIENKPFNRDFYMEAPAEQAENEYIWQWSFMLPENYIVTDKISGDTLKNGTLAIAFEFLLEDNGKEKLSYINEKNSLRGYCNMWKLQGGAERVTINDEGVKIKSGVTFLTSVGGEVREDYEVVGTH